MVLKHFARNQGERGELCFVQRWGGRGLEQSLAWGDAWSCCMVCATRRSVCMQKESGLFGGALAQAAHREVMESPSLGVLERRVVVVLGIVLSGVVGVG